LVLEGKNVTFQCSFAIRKIATQISYVAYSASTISSDHICLSHQDILFSAVSSRNTINLQGSKIDSILLCMSSKMSAIFWLVNFSV